MQRLILSVIFTFLASTAALADAPTSPFEMVGKTLTCVGSAGSIDTFTLKFTAKRAYHRDGIWYEAEFNGPVIHTYVFVSNGYITRADRVGYTYDAFIQRDGIRSISLVQVFRNQGSEIASISGKGTAMPNYPVPEFDLDCTL